MSKFLRSNRPHSLLKAEKTLVTSPWLFPPRDQHNGQIPAVVSAEGETSEEESPLRH